MTRISESPLTTGLLAAVSRSFYLSLRLLPKAVRSPVSLAYLLARAADTIADAPVVTAAERLSLLEAFGRGVTDGRPDGAFLAAAKDFSRTVEHNGERVLLKRLPECFAALDRCSAVEAEFIRTVLQRIVRGQALDLQRFADPSRIVALPDAAALDEYTWLVAGCVGEFWTEICLLHLPRCASLTRSELLHHATLYGKGLQLVNILRDQPKDMAAGRCYLPEDELHAAGLESIAWPVADWRPWHAVRQRWLNEARERLHEGRTYVTALTQVRLRCATLLPILIGEETLDLLDQQPDNEQPRVAKVSRARIRRLMLRAAWLAVRGKA